MKDLDLQIKMVKYQNEWRKIYVDDHWKLGIDILVHVADSNILGSRL